MKIAAFVAITLSASPLAAADLLIHNVNIVDVESGTLLPNRHVFVSDGKIERITGTDESGIATETIDGTGKYLMPGLIDMHVHTGPSGLPLFLQYGVTTIRDMGTQFAPLEPDGGQQLTWREEVAEGTRAGPEMILALRILDGDIPRNPQWAMHYASIATAEEGRSYVDRVQRAGGDFIKVYTDLNSDVFAAIAERAAALGMPVAGHVPGQVGYEAAARAGLHTAEHLRGIFIDTSSEENRWRAEFTREAAKLDASATYEFTNDRLTEMAKSYDPEKAAALFTVLKNENVGMVPTLVVLDDPRWTYPGAVPDPEIVGQLSPIYQRIVSPQPDIKAPFKSVADAKAAFALRLKLVGDIKAAGVDILVGTDSANPFVLPGISVHQELGHLVDAGFTAAEALHAATLLNARYLGAEQRIGSITEGKEADLIMLSGNPLDDIANSQTIEAVFTDGRKFLAEQ